MSALELPPMLLQAGCRLLVEGRTLLVLDRDGRELERGTRGRWAWLLNASAAALIERWSGALGLRHELHGWHLQFRLWRPGECPEAAPWLDFAEALAWLASQEAACLLAKCLPAQVWRLVVRTLQALDARGRGQPERVVAAWYGAAGRAPPSWS